jgi:hypothetical protein
MDIVQGLLGEHGVLYAQFEYLEETVPGLSLGVLKAQAEMLAAALRSHSSLEDELLFAALEPVLGAGSPELLGMRMMHEEIDRGLESCRAAEDERGAQGDLLGVVGLARQHFLGEEQAIFPVAQARLTKAGREALGAQWAARRGVTAGGETKEAERHGA